MTLLAFIGLCLAWSFSWFAMKLQVESFVALEISVFYRFFFTAILMFCLCKFFKQRISISRRETKFLSIIALCNFCLNFLIGYYAVRFIPSGVIAVVFSLSIIISEILSCLINGKKVEKKIILSGALGFIGLTFFIAPTLHFSDQINKTIIGFLLSLLMVSVYSIGNFVFAKHKEKNHTPLFTSLAYGSGIGAIYILIYNLALGNQFAFDFSAKYVSSLAYLVVVASVGAFICLFYLIQTIGSAKANYTALVYPTIALLISGVYENFHFNFFSIIGLMLIILALVIDFLPKKYVS